MRFLPPEQQLASSPCLLANNGEWSRCSKPQPTSHLQLCLSLFSWAWYEQKKERQCLPNCSHLSQGLQTMPCEPYDETCAIKAGERVLNGSTVMLAHIHCSFINTLACCCRCQYTALARACCYYNWLMDKNCGQSAWLRLPSLEGVSACLQRFTAPQLAVAKEMRIEVVPAAKCSSAITCAGTALRCVLPHCNCSIAQPCNT